MYPPMLIISDVVAVIHCCDIILCDLKSTNSDCMRQVLVCGGVVIIHSYNNLGRLCFVEVRFRLEMPNRKRRMGKEKAMPQVLGSNADPDSNAVQQFDLELQWCIQQLEAALTTSKMASKQGQDAAHLLTILRSKKTPVIKKRQVMRSSFGDYRTKMAEEEKKLNKGKLLVSVSCDALNVTAQERICIAAPAPDKKSCFVKRSAVMCEPSQNNFRFNFDGPVDKERTSTSQPTTSHSNFVYKTSDNSFRFNFVQPTC